MIPILLESGYRVVYAEDLGFVDQVALFSSASHIVASHGGGLANLAWATPGCKVLEIFSPATIRRRCYWALSHVLGLRHFYIVGETDGIGDPDAGYSVEPDLLSRAIRSLEDFN